MKNTPLDPSLLYKPCAISQFNFDTTDELDDLDIILGQERAMESIRFGIRIKGKGYNIFALAPDGTGKLTTVRQLAEQEAGHQTVPSDWCYVNNFTQPAKPKAIELPPGKGQEFKNDMEQLIEELSIAIPAAFNGDEYRAKAEEIEEESRQKEIREIKKIKKEALDKLVVLVETPTGYAFAPIDDKEVAITPELFNQLPEDEKDKIQAVISKLQNRLQKLLKKFPNWRKQTRRKLKELNQEIAQLAVNHSIDELMAKYADQEAILTFLDNVQKDIIEHFHDFIPHREQQQPFLELQKESDPFKRYQVNLIIDFSGTTSAPVVYEDHPNYINLLGRIDHQAYMGSLITDFTMIKPGALHRANGGYLILDARKLLFQPYAWDSLKRILQSGFIRIESLEHSLSLISASSLEPEPIPLDLKLILIGDRLIYYLLSIYDPEFQDLFKVAADFDDSVARDDSNLDYARMLATITRKENIRPLSRRAVARTIEHCSRLVSDAEKLSTHLRSIKDLLSEADYWSKDNKHECITCSDVQQAIDHKTYRLDRVREKLYENIHRGTVLIDTDGQVTGQINGLSVLQLGDFTFGQPSRISATTRLGNGKVIDIERETELGGAIHSKGVFILSNYISSRYAKTSPFSITASLVFEQSYGRVDGDSASLAELCVILSSLAQIPLRQDLAMTGSINQLGQVQPIGGTNEKIEGFYDICKARGLTGTQGVIIPDTNINFLMLRWDIVHAAQDGQFHIYSVNTVDEAMELLTGQESGKADEQGEFPAETVNGKVENQLRQYTSIKQSFLKNNDKND